MPSSARTHLGATLLLGGISLFLFRDAIFHGEVFVGRNDRIRNVIPFYYEASQALRDGNWGGWTSRSLCGMPLLGNPVTFYLYPPNLLVCLLMPKAIAWGLGIRIACELFLAGLGWYLFFLRWTASSTSAVLCALCGMLNSSSTEAANYGTLGTSMTWFPWVLWALGAIDQGSTGKRIALTSLFLSLQWLGGMSQYNAYHLIFYIVWATLAGGREGRRRRLTVLSGAILLSLGLTALQWIPAVLQILSSNRTHVSLLESRQRYGQFRCGIVRFWMPYFFGTDDNFPRLLGSGSVHSIAEMYPIYPGLLASLASLWTLPRFRSSRVWPWLLLMLLSTLVVGGTPATAIPYYLFLGTDLRHSQCNLFIPLGAALLMAEGLKQIDDLPQRRRRRFPLALGSLTIAALLLTADPILKSFLSFFPPEIPKGIVSLPTWEERARSALLTLALSSGALAVWTGGWTWERIGTPLFRLGLIVFSAADLTWAAHHSLLPRSCPEESLYPPNATASFLSSRPDLDRYRVHIQPLKLPWPAAGSILHDGERTYRPNLNMPYGIPDPNGYTPTIETHYSQLLGEGEPLPRQRLLSITNPHLLDRLAVKYIVHDRQDPLAKIRTGFRTIFEDGERIVRERTSPVPRFQLIRHALYFSDDRRLLQELLEGKHDPRSTVLLMEGEPALEPSPLASGEESPDRLEVTQTHEGLIRGTAETACPAFWVVRDSGWNGWKAEVNGKPAPILRADYAFRAIPLPAGRSEIVLRYHPPYLPGLIGLTGASAIAYLLLLKSSGKSHA
jgi:hypothetical protein